MRLAVIPNTLELTELWVSTPLVADARALSHLEIMGDPQPLPLTANGDLEQEKLFPHCLRARRKRS